MANGTFQTAPWKSLSEVIRLTSTFFSESKTPTHFLKLYFRDITSVVLVLLAFAGIRTIIEDQRCVWSPGLPSIRLYKSTP